MDTRYSESIHIIGFGMDPVYAIVGILGMVIVVAIFAYVSLHQVRSQIQYWHYMMEERRLTRERIKTEKAKRQLIKARTHTEGDRQSLIGILGMLAATRIQATQQKMLEQQQLFQQQMLNAQRQQQQMLDLMRTQQQQPQLPPEPVYRAQPQRRQPLSLPKPAKMADYMGPIIDADAQPVTPKRIELPPLPKLPQLNQAGWDAEARRLLGGGNGKPKQLGGPKK